MRIRLPLSLLAAVFACSHFVSPAHTAARDRVFVASYGSDSNPCTFGSPCKTFQNAVNVVADGGEVTAIDSAGFGPINITKPVTITSPDGVEAGIVPNAGSPAVSINTTGDVFLRGLTIEGNNSVADGISLTGGGAPGSPATLSIVHCVIRHFTHDGIYLQPTGMLSLAIVDTIAANNKNDGIDLSPSGSGYLQGVIDHSTAIANGTDGIAVWGANATGGGGLAFISIVNSVVANNAANGVKAYTASGGAATSVGIRDTTGSNNAWSFQLPNSADFFVDGNAKMVLAHVNAPEPGESAIYIGSSAALETFGDNHIVGGVSGTSISLIKPF
jgi:hypothetical protein